MPSRRSVSHRPSARCCTRLTAPLLLAVPADPSSHHGCVDGVEKAYQELQFVWRRPRTAEIRCSRGAPSAPRIFAVQFKFTDETVAVSHQHARCCLRDELGSSVTTSAGSSYRSAATHMCVACVAMHSCVLCRLLKVGAILAQFSRLETPAVSKPSAARPRPKTGMQPPNRSPYKLLPAVSPIRYLVLGF